MMSQHDGNKRTDERIVGRVKITLRRLQSGGKNHGVSEDVTSRCPKEDEIDDVESFPLLFP